MRKHLVSFARGPLGYVLNFIATVLVHVERLPFMERPAMAAGDWLSNVCEVICLRDGVQDDMLF